MKFLIFTAIVILLVTNLAGQIAWPAAPPGQLPWIADSVNQQNNLYDFSGNPAALFEDEQSKQLWMGHVSDFSDGDHHHPFEPASIYAQRYFVQTVYPVDENDLFKGFFTYSRQNDRDVMWADQNRNLNLNPYLLADSSTGDFEMSGLSWAAEWAHRINAHWLTGATFYYNVDQRLKQVFPKPLNSHRDIHVQLGTQYQQGAWSLAAHYRLMDEQEKVEISRYSLDQGLTPLLYKFRYSDLPLIMRGKTSEERKSSWNTHQFNLQGRFESPVWNVLASSSYSKTSGETIDGGSRKDEQGTIEMTGLESHFRVTGTGQTLQFYLDYQFAWNELTVQHPDFNLETIKHPFSEHDLRVGLSTQLSGDIKLFGETRYQYLWDQFEDRMTVNYYEYQRHQLGGKAGVDYRLNRRWKGQIWAGYSGFNFDGLNSEETIYSEYFNPLFRDKLEYLTGSKNDWCAGSRLTFSYFPVFEIDLLMNWYQIKAKTDQRNNLYLALMTKMFIF